MSAHAEEMKIFLHVGISFLLMASFYIVLILGDTRKRSKMAKGIKIFFYSPNKSKKDITDGYKFLSKVAAKSEHINIQASTGWMIFGDKNAPLHNALNNCIQANIFLINPLSEAAKIRAQSLENYGLTYEKYKEEVFQSIKYLDTLRKARLSKGQSANIVLKMYSKYPTWKFIIIPPELIWVQYYPDNDHVKHAPCYAFERDHDKKGLYFPFSRQFDSRFTSHMFGKYNFDRGILEFTDQSGVHLPEKDITIMQMTP
jgi:hypothetical protein